MNNAVQWYRSKRLWTGVLSLLTGITLILTQEKTLQDSLPELITIAFGIVQTIVGLISGEPVAFGSKTFHRPRGKAFEVNGQK